MLPQLFGWRRALSMLGAYAPPDCALLSMLEPTATAHGAFRRRMRSHAQAQTRAPAQKAAAAMAFSVQRGEQLASGVFKALRDKRAFGGAAVTVTLEGEGKGEPEPESASSPADEAAAGAGWLFGAFARALQHGEGATSGLLAQHGEWLAPAPAPVPAEAAAEAEVEAADPATPVAPKRQSASAASEAAARLAQFRAVGAMVGLSLLHGVPLPLPLCRHVRKFLLGRPLTLADLVDFAPREHALCLQRAARAQEIVCSGGADADAIWPGDSDDRALRWVTVLPGALAEAPVAPRDAAIFGDCFAQHAMVRSAHAAALSHFCISVLEVQCGDVNTIVRGGLH